MIHFRLESKIESETNQINGNSNIIICNNHSNRFFKEPAKLVPPEIAVKDGFEKPIAKASASPNRPVTGNGSLPTRPSSSRRPPSRTARNNLTVIHQDSRWYFYSDQLPTFIIVGAHVYARSTISIEMHFLWRFSIRVCKKKGRNPSNDYPPL